MDDKKKARVLMFLHIALVVETAAALCILILIATHSLPGLYPKAKMTLYDGPKTMHTSAKTQVTVNGHPLFVYDTHVDNSHKWVDNGDVTLSETPVAYFDMSGNAVVEITLPGTKVTSAKVTPASWGITPQISGNTVRFPISKTGDYTVEFNGGVERALHLFVNPLETNIPNKDDPNVIYIGPGEWNVNNISLEDGQTLYIAGGAVIHGTILGNMASNITVRGRGIIDGSVYPSWVLEGQTAKVPIDFRNCKNVKVEGITVLDPNAWTFNSFQTEKADIENVKLISARPNGDGFTFQSCRDFTIKNCFVRTWDDSLVVKNYGINSDSITFDGIQVWTDLAQSCEIGYETNKGNQADSRITNITFQNITVLHNFHKPVIGIHNSDNALVRDILYKNIVVEDAEMGSGDAGTNNQLIDMAIDSSGWSTTSDRGNIRNVTIDGLTILSGVFAPSSLKGYDETHTIENVTIKNLNILGKKILDKKTGLFKINPFTKNIVFQ